MKKTIIAVSAVLALAASVMAASTNTVTISGTTYALSGSPAKITTFKFANSFFIEEDGFTTKTAQLLYVTSADTNDAVIVAATAQGHVLATNVIVHTAAGGIVSVTGTNGSVVTTDANLAFTLVPHGTLLGGSGNLFVTQTKTATAKTLKATGQFGSTVDQAGNVTTNPGTVAISVSGTFKPKP